MHNHSDLVTLSYLIRCLEILDYLPVETQSLDLESYFYETETRSNLDLSNHVTEYFDDHDIEYIIDKDLYEIDKVPLEEADEEKGEEEEAQLN